MLNSPKKGGVLMPIVEVYCLPTQVSQEQLNDLHREIIETVESVPELGLKDKNAVSVLFPMDRLIRGLSDEIIIIKVIGLFVTPERSPAVRQKLAERLGSVVAKKFSNTIKTECFVFPFDPEDGFWSST